MSSDKASGNGGMSYWIDTTPATHMSQLTEDHEADVAIIGGGIAGLTSAYLLAKAGKRVVVLERDHITLAETGHTTAHLQIARLGPSRLHRRTVAGATRLPRPRRRPRPTTQRSAWAAAA